jgi:small subunit ribosomal protein S20
MPITSSAKKALRAGDRKRVFNLRRKGELQSTIKKVKKLVAEKKATEAAKALSVAYKALDKAAKTGFIKKNAAARKKSRLALLLKKAA